MVMPFGRYRGREIEDLPSDYLDWLLSIEIRDRLRDAVERELEARCMREYVPAPEPFVIHLRPGEVDLARLVFDLGYRAAAKALHPDAGGDPDDMIRLNAFAENVRGQLSTMAVRV
jgi:hypothetical protein